MTNPDDMLKALPQWQAIASVIQARKGSCTAAESFIPAMVKALEALSSRIQPADDAVEPVAYLKTWQSVEGYPRSRVDLTDVCEPWLAELKPTITPLVPALAPQGEKAEG